MRTILGVVEPGERADLPQGKAFPISWTIGVRSMVPQSDGGKLGQPEVGKDTDETVPMRRVGRGAMLPSL